MPDITVEPLSGRTMDQRGYWEIEKPDVADGGVPEPDR